jgi:hypothetical protein
MPISVPIWRCAGSFYGFGDRRNDANPITPAHKFRTSVSDISSVSGSLVAASTNSKKAVRTAATKPPILPLVGNNASKATHLHSIAPSSKKGRPEERP